MSIHRTAHRHAGRRRWLGAWHHQGRHVIGAAPEPAPQPCTLPARPAPGLDVRPIHARPRGPHPYDPWPATAPMTAIPAHLAELAIEPAIERRVA